MAAWAIEAEAALMEVETIHYQHAATANCDEMYRQQEIQTTTARPQNLTWAQEFSHADSVTEAAVSNSSDRKEAESVRQDRNSMRRGSVVKTCGFMLESKSHWEASDPVFLDAEVSSFKATNSQFQPDDSHAAISTPPPPGLLPLEQISAPFPSICNGSIHSQPDSMPHMEDISATVKEQPGQVFNDDLFEGDMLKAWMETLAQEKQEANERVLEAGRAVEDEETTTVKKSVEDDSKDRLVLEVALRRLNVLMRQLGRAQKSLGSPFGSTGSKSKLPPMLPSRDHIHSP
ncbi:hypothetical protein EC957_005754 [Mortierella hygrophila]|uniref:Uncharacterized protein n=1 Tax=Mortierella hygrophila TaxID=979708 RepID=A0A9P6F0T2_9FUNG|nr:hypothetical protein EC957_005754 [Mortierella hygrophila]